MNAPLAIYMAYHKKYAEGTNLYSRMYKLLCRDAHDMTMDGLDIPVYFTTDGNVDVTRGKRIAVIWLIDEYMYRDKKYVEVMREWLNKADDKNLSVLPVKLFKYAFDAVPSNKPIQSIALPTDSIEDNWEEFQTRIYDYLIRFFKGEILSRVNIFISHSKRDKDNVGEIRAKELRDYLRANTKLYSFFDVNDIQDGVRFDSRIEQGVENALLMVLFTNTYSSREWCKREVIVAKKKNVPTIAVFMLDGHVKRVFPYIGNIPSTAYNKDWRLAINLLLRTALDQYHEEELLKEVAGPDDVCLPFAPEAFNLRSVGEDKRLIYPEPPLGKGEIDLLKEIKNVRGISTPMECWATNVDFAGKNIAISVSESDDISQYGCGLETMDDLMIELPKHILCTNGRMVYGGDLRVNGYTKLFADLSYQYGQREEEDALVMYFTNYLSWPLYLKDKENFVHVESDYGHHRVDLKTVGPSDVVPEEYRHKWVSPDTTEHLYWWGKSLTIMRETMEGKVCARVLAGGRISGFKGCMPGLIEEFKLAWEEGHPVYLIGGLGGAIRMISNVIRGIMSAEELLLEVSKSNGYKELLAFYNSKGENIDYNWLESITIDSLCENNGLDEDDNRLLFSSTNVMEIVSLVLKGLKEKLKDE